MDEIDIGERGFGSTGDGSVVAGVHLGRGVASASRATPDRTCLYLLRPGGDRRRTDRRDFEALMYPVMDAIRFLYERSEQSLFWSNDVTRRYTSWEVAQELCTWAVSDRVLEAILDLITPDEWNKDPGALAPNVALYYAWHNFCEKVKHETRFVFLSSTEEHSDHPDDFTTREILDKLMEIVQFRKILTDIPAGRVFTVAGWFMIPRRLATMPRN